MIFISFYTTTHSMKAEREAQKQGRAVTMIPTPRGVAGSCSLSLRFDGKEPEADGRAFFASMAVPCALFRLEGTSLDQISCKEVSS